MRWLYQQVTEALGTSYSSLAEAIAAAAGSVDLSVIEADIAVLQSDVAVHETRLDALETDVGDLQTDVAGVVSDVAAIEANQNFRIQTIHFRGDNLGPNASLAFYFKHDGGAVDTAIANAQCLVNNPGKFRNLSFKMITTAADNDTFSLFLNINGSNTALTIPNIAPSDASLHSDTTHEVSVSKGDFWCIQQLNGANSVSGNDWSLSIDFVVDA